MRPKKMFRAPMWGTFAAHDSPAFVRQLLSERALASSGYFDARAISRAIAEYPQVPRRSPWRMVLEMGLINVLATQLWHHVFNDGNMADLPHCRPTWPAAARPERDRWTAEHVPAAAGFDVAVGARH